MKCKRCGTDEDRVDGYCTVDCEEKAELDAEIARLKEGMAKDCKTCKLGLEEDLIELQAKHENVAQHRRDLVAEVERLRGGTPGPNESCSDCGHAMLWVNSTWICPEHVHNRMRQAEASVKQLEGEVRAAAQINTVQMDQAREAELQLSKAKARNAELEAQRAAMLPVVELAKAIYCGRSKAECERIRGRLSGTGRLVCNHTDICDAVRVLKLKEDGKTSEGA